MTEVPKPFVVGSLRQNFLRRLALFGLTFEMFESMVAAYVTQIADMPTSAKEAEVILIRRGIQQKEFSMEVFLIAYQIIEYAVSIIPQPRLYRRKP